MSAKVNAKVSAPVLPPCVTVLERGWLSANGIVFSGPQGTALVDSGYHTHAAQTRALVDNALAGQPLGLLINTHLHSDHCGGNAALQQRYPGLHTAIPPGQVAQVQTWCAAALGFTAAGQQCPPFRYTSVLRPGSEMQLGTRAWQVHAAPGHDPHSVVLFEPQSRVLIAADALWHNGFGVVFPELDGIHAFEEVRATLALITTLAPRTVIPGHGSVFCDVEAALERAQRRLDSFVCSPRKHAHYAAKVLLKFKLLELQRVPLPQLTAWASDTPHLVTLHAGYFCAVGSLPVWVHTLVDDLVRSGAARLEGGDVVNV